MKFIITNCRRFLFIAPIIVLVGVVAYFILTTSPFVRFWADDFCSAAFVRDNGLWGALVISWKTWSGRYSYIAFLDVFEIIGLWTDRVLPVLIAVLASLALIPVFSFEVVLAPFFVVLVLINAPNLIQSFYWQAASFNYTFEFIFLNLLLFLFVWPKKKWALPLAFFLPLVAGGFSESYALAQIVLIFFIMLIILVGNFPDKKLRLKLTAAGLTGAILSVLIMLLSPGNAVRSSLVGHPPSFFFVVKSTVYGTRWYLERMLLVKPFVYSLIISALAIFLSVERNRKMFAKLFFGTKKMVLIMVLSFLLAIFSVAAVIFSGFYAEAITPPERTMVIAIYMILVSFFIFCFTGSTLLMKFVKENFRKYLIYVAISFNIVFSVLLIESVVSSWGLIRNQLSDYAGEWDKQAELLENASRSGKTAVIKYIKPVGEIDGLIENKGWVLGCVKGYYQLKDIKLK